MVVYALDDPMTGMQRALQRVMVRQYLSLGFFPGLSVLPTKLKTFRVRIPKLMEAGKTFVDMTVFSIPFPPAQRKPADMDVDTWNRFKRWYREKHNALALRTLKDHVDFLVTSVVTKEATVDDLEESLWNVSGLIAGRLKERRRTHQNMTQIMNIVSPLFTNHPVLADRVLEVLPWFFEDVSPDALNQLVPDDDTVTMLQSFVSSVRKALIQNRKTKTMRALGEAYATYAPSLKPATYSKHARRT